MLVCVEALSRLTLCPFYLSAHECRCERPNHPRSNLVLKRKDVIESTVKAVGPNMMPRLSVDELPCQANAIVCFSYRPFEHVAHPEFAPYLAHLSGPVSVCKAGIPRDDEKSTYL